MVEKVRKALRIGADTLDDEIADVIAAAEADLRRVGVTVPAAEDDVLADPLLVRAVTLYAKANVGYDDNAEKYDAAYKYIACGLALCSDYNGGDTE